MEAMALNFRVMLGFITKAVAIIKDPRQLSNATRYSIKDTIPGCIFSVFYAVRIVFGTPTSNA